MIKGVNRVLVRGQATSSFAPEMYSVGFQHTPLLALPLHCRAGIQKSADFCCPLHGEDWFTEHIHVRGKPQESAREGKGSGDTKLVH